MTCKRITPIALLQNTNSMDGCSIILIVAVLVITFLLFSL